MTRQQKSEDLNSLIFLTEKFNGTVKTRMCGDVSKQRRCLGYKKEDSLSPTVSLEGVLPSSASKPQKSRHIVCFDIPGVFLCTKCGDWNIFMLLKGNLAELMTLVEPKLHREHVRYNNEKGQAMLNVVGSLVIFSIFRWPQYFLSHDY